MDPKKFGIQNFSKSRSFQTQIFFVIPKFFGPKIYLGQQIFGHTVILDSKVFRSKNQPSGEGAHRLQRPTACNAAPPATPHHRQNPKWPPGGPKKWPTGSRKVFTPMFLGILLLNKFFDPSTLSMRKGHNEGEKTGGNKKRLMKIVATTSLPAADRWNATRLCQFFWTYCHKPASPGRYMDTFRI